MIFQYFKKSGSESTFRIGGGSLNEDDDGAAVENGLYFGMPDSFILFELIFVFLSNGGEGLKNGSNIIWFRLKKYFFVGLGNKNSGSFFNVEFLKDIRTFLCTNAEVLDIIVLAKDIDGVGEILQVLTGGLIPLSMKDKDKNVSKVAEKSSHQFLIRLESLHLLIHCWFLYNISVDTIHI